MTVPNLDMVRPSTYPTRRSLRQASSRIVEIEGLRGIALTLVVLFHLFGNGRVSGGVDVFLVISAFLLSPSILRKATQDGGARLGPHFAGVAARLVPPAAIVLAAVAVATLLLAPVSAQRQNLIELIASALYYENWELIRSQLTYGAAGPNSSPLQHFWSLSLQGQFFLIWPFVVITLVWIARKLSWSPKGVVMWMTLLATTVSAAYAFRLTAADQSVAYLNSYARFWELGLGILLGLAMPQIRLTRVVRVTAMWTGLTLIITCGFFVDGGSLFPGPWTLWPVVGTLLVLLASGTKETPFATSVLSSPILKFFARISYPLYLWHWPILVFYLQVRGYDAIGLKGAAFVFALSVFLAWVTTTMVEQPVAAFRRRASALRLSFVPIATCLTVIAVASACLVVVEQQRAEQLQALSSLSANHVGARALTEGVTPITEQVDTLPDPSVARYDGPAIDSQNCVQSPRNEPGMEEVLVCDPSNMSPTRTIIMSGGSHVRQWYPAMVAIAEQENWALVVIDKDGCRLTEPDESRQFNTTCYAWNERALPIILELNPDAVFTVGTETGSPRVEAEYTSPGQVAVWREIADAGIPVITIRDNPRFPFDVPKCVEALSSEDLTPCGISRSDTYAAESPFFEVTGLPETVTHIDLADAFCTVDRCEATVGNVLAYRDTNHITASYAVSLAPALRRELVAVAPWLFS